MRYEETIRKCPICECEDYTQVKIKPKWSPARLITDDTHKPFHRIDVMCHRCGTVYKNPMLTPESMNAFYSGPYAELYKEKQQYSISKSAINEGVMTTIYTLDWLRKIGFPLKGKKVFEIGTGLGTLMKGFAGEGATVDGLDADKRSIDIANKLFGFNFKGCLMRDFPLDEHKKRYDVVVCNNTMEHFYNPLWLMSIIQSMIVPGGHVILELPDIRKPYPHTIIDGFLSSAHNFTISREGVENLASKSGFRVKNIDNDGHKKCFLILLEEDPKALNNPLVTVHTDNRKEEILSLFRECDLINVKNQQAQKELSEGIYVNTSIYRLKEDNPHTYNQRSIPLANAFLEQGKPFDGLNILTEYGPDQPEDPNCCLGSFIYIKAMCHRQIGDFITAKQLLEECALHYPNIRKYNFVKDLEIDGLVSNSTFANYLWWNAERVLQTFG